MSRRIALFARWPAVGQVKTRLSPALPAGPALELYRSLVADALEAARGSGADERFVYWADANATADEAERPPDFVARAQRGPDLGARLERAFSELLAGGGQAVVIGADCPLLDAARIDQAFAALDSSEVVLGPSRDGGYYLVGLRCPAPELFRGVAWSTERVLDQTLESARRLALSVRTLEPLDDLDTPEDLVRWIARAIQAPEPPPLRSLAAMRAMGLLPPTPRRS